MGLWTLAVVGLIPVLVWTAKSAFLAKLWKGYRPATRECEGKLVPLGTLDRKDLKQSLTPKIFTAADGREIEFTHDGRLFTAETTLDARLQQYMLGRIGRARSLMVGFVAVDPETGHVLSMVETNNTDDSADICLSSRFPAASVFKIVAAAAAIDGRRISADTKLEYNGQSHTLYKKQLTNRTNRYTNRVTLRDCFAKSINPAFGKLGIYELKKDLLEEYAGRFGFNEPIDFELPVEMSRISVGDNDYHWAEIACGFNRETLISPLHGALLAATIVNEGKLVSPVIVDFVVDSQKNPVYVGGSQVVRQAISPEASKEMKELMHATVSYGTSRRAFRGYRRDRVLSQLHIGGKTGSIKNEDDRFFYDWFVGFGEQKKGGKKLALAVLVVHGKLLRARAHEYARLAFRYYFDSLS
jgi:cell division protein FtsI/penicillin-binding protein 2